VVSHLDESSLHRSSQESRLLWLPPSKSNVQPVVTTVQVKEAGELKSKLRIRVPSTQEYTAVRQSLSQLAEKLPTVKQVEGSKSTLFVFEPTDFSFMRKVAPAFASSKEAQLLVDGHVAELLKFEKALSPEAVAKFSARRIGGFRETFVDNQGQVRPFELSPIQRLQIARLELDGWRGVVTLAPGFGKTLVALSALELMAKAGEKRPFLVVVPEGLQGNFTAEIFSKRTPDAALRLNDQLRTMTYTEFRRAVRKGQTSDGQPFSADQFGAVIYDEVHVATDRKTANGKALLKFGHERSIEMTGTPQPQPERLQMMDAVARGVDLNSPSGRAELRKARQWRNLLFANVNGITTGVRGELELRRGLKVDPSREMLEWIRSRFIYADTPAGNFSLPKRSDVHLTIKMDPKLEATYRKAKAPADVGLEGLVSIHRDGGLAPAAEGAEATARRKLTPQARDARVHDVRTTLKPTIDALSALTNNEQKLVEVGKKLMQMHAEDVHAGQPASRALLFTDELAYVHESARVMSSRIPVKLHVSADANVIRVWQNGKEFKGDFGPLKAPFDKKQAYRPDPTKPVSDTNREIVPEHWRTFVLNEIIGKHHEVSTTSLHGPTYQTGQNLQWANVVVHLDRDTWDDFNMIQRERRVLRQGQLRPVTVMHADFVYEQPRGPLDRTLDQVRELKGQTDRKLLQQTLVAAQDITLGEGMSPARSPASFERLPDPGLYTLGAEPTAANVGRARALP